MTERPTRKRIDYILERIEHRLAWAEQNNMPDDLPAMVRDLAAFVERKPRRHRRGCPLFTHPSQRPPDHPTECTCRRRK